MNPFDRSLEETFRARKARVIARDGAEYTGFVERIKWNDRHFILHGAENGEGEHVGAVLVSHAERVELVDEPLRVERILLEEISPSPYAVKEFDREANLEYIETLREHGVRRNFPVVRPIDDGDDGSGYELVDGHKGIWACRCAGLDAQPCEIVELSDWEATERFVYDHFPTPRHVSEGGTTEDEWYDEEAITAAIERLAADWGDRILDLYAVEYNADRLGIELSNEESEGEADASVE